MRIGRILTGTSQEKQRDAKEVHLSDLGRRTPGKRKKGNERKK